VNQRLWDMGYEACRVGAYRFVHHSPCSTVPRLLAHHFRRGRAYGRILRNGGKPSRGLLSFALGIPRHRLREIERRLGRWGDGFREEYRRARPLVVLAAVASGAGTLFGLLPARFRP
jgi:hypothetical protein